MNEFCYIFLDSAKKKKKKRGSVNKNEVFYFQSLFSNIRIFNSDPETKAGNRMLYAHDLA